MTARAARRFVQSIPRSSNFEHVHNLANFTTSNQTLNNLIMQPKFSEGQDESKVMAELEALVEGGWKLDGEQIGIQRTYHFKTYTKVLVGDTTNCHSIAKIFRTFTTILE